MRPEMRETIARNMSIEELVRVGEPWCAQAIMEELATDPDLLMTYGEIEQIKEDSYEAGEESIKVTLQDVISILDQVDEYFDGGDFGSINDGSNVSILRRKVKLAL